MDVDLGHKDIEKIWGDVQEYMMRRKRFLSIIGFKFENINGERVSINGRSITFSLPIKEVRKWTVFLLLNDEDKAKVRLLS